MRLLSKFIYLLLCLSKREIQCLLRNCDQSKGIIIAIIPTAFDGDEDERGFRFLNFVSNDKVGKLLY